MHKINEQYKYTHPHTHGMSVLTPEYTDQVVVTIKSLATGQTMKVYLDEPTQTVERGVNVTRYTGHFYEEEFMVTWSEGLEITGLPLMYPYLGQDLPNDGVVVIDTKNHYYSEKFAEQTSSKSFGFLPYGLKLMDSPYGQGNTSNFVEYEFSRFSSTSEDEEPEGPIVVPANPDETS